MLFALKLDGPLLVGLALIAAYGLVVLYSASGQSMPTILRTWCASRIGTVAMLLLAQVSPNFLRRSTPWLYAIGVLAAAGGRGHRPHRQGRAALAGSRADPLPALRAHEAGGADDVRLVPARAAAAARAGASLLVLAGIILVPVALVAMQPDLGTAVLIAAAGALVIVLAGLRVRVMAGARWRSARSAPGSAGTSCTTTSASACCIFLDPQTDPLGAGYHIIQSQIAIGSGGVFGKGWMNGSQAQLEFLPERSTDFIFAVIGEEFGLLGLIVLLLLYLFIVAARCSWPRRPRTPSRGCCAGSLALTFFVYVFINAGMVSGLLPVVGVPLPLVSYGGTSVVTLLAGFGILMGLYSHRKLVRS